MNSKILISSICFSKMKKNFLDYILQTKIKNIELATTMVSNKNNLSELKSFARIIKKKNISVKAMQSIFFNTNINIENKNFNKEFLQHMNKIVKICKLFNCKTINLGSATLREFKNKKNVKFYMNSFKKSLLNFLKKNKNINLNIEPVYKNKNKNFLLADYTECISFVKNLNLDNLKVVYDNGIASSQKFKLDSRFINDDIFGHVQLNSLFMSPINLKRYNFIINYFIKNNYNYYFSIESFFNSRTFNDFLKKYDFASK